MLGQAIFDFTAPPAPAVGEVESLVSFLKQYPGFHTARQLNAALDLTDRKIRQLAEASDGLIVSGPGSPGYCHIIHCSAELLSHIPETLISQGKHMIRRALRIRRRAHQIIR